MKRAGSPPRRKMISKPTCGTAGHKFDSMLLFLKAVMLLTATRLHGRRLVLTFHFGPDQCPVVKSVVTFPARKRNAKFRMLQEGQ